MSNHYHETEGLSAPLPVIQLSKREREVVTLISQGLSNKEIANALFLSINSVKTYIRTAYRRVGCESRSQAVIWGIRNEVRLRELAAIDDRLAILRHGPGPMSKRPLTLVRPGLPG